MSEQKTKVAIIGPGNIGTDLMIKVMRNSETLEMGVMVGIDPTSDGLERASRFGFEITSEGIEGLVALPIFDELDVVFDATSAASHKANAAALAPYDKLLIDLTPAAIGPFVVPAVNVANHLDAKNVNMVTCDGQATIPIVAAISRIAPVVYAEIVAMIASKSAGPGTRANIDEFTETTAHAICRVGGAARGKAIIILNPADPPPIMHDTVFALIDSDNSEVHNAIRMSIEQMVDEVSEYVPGYRLKQQVQILPVPDDQPVHTLTDGQKVTHQVSVFLEVEGAGHYLPAYAGNVDIMTSAALRTAERFVAAQSKGSAR